MHGKFSEPGSDGDLAPSVNIWKKGIVFTNRAIRHEIDAGYRISVAFKRGLSPACPVPGFTELYCRVTSIGTRRVTELASGRPQLAGTASIVCHGWLLLAKGGRPATLDEGGKIASARPAPKVIRRTLLAMVVVGFLPTFAQFDPDFTWAQHTTLTWHNFKGQPPKFAPSPSALTDTGLFVELFCNKGVSDVQVEAYFNPNLSWVKPKDKTAQLLKHEQGHFDITELYARRLRKAIRDAKISCDDRAKAQAVRQKIVNQLQKDYAAAEQQYDIDTKDGTDTAQQNAASNTIATDLAALNAYRR